MCQNESTWNPWQDDTTNTSFFNSKKTGKRTMVFELLKVMQWFCESDRTSRTKMKVHYVSHLSRAQATTKDDELGYMHIHVHPHSMGQGGFPLQILKLDTNYLLRGFPHVDTRGGCMSTLGNREVHTNPPTIYLHPCTLLLGYFSILRALKVHERESPRPASLEM